MNWRYQLNDGEEIIKEKEQQPQIFINQHVGSSGVVKVVENTIYFYNDITENSILDLNCALHDLDAKLRSTYCVFDDTYKPHIKLRISSYGGSLFAGLAVLDFIRNLKSDVYTYIDGSAASAATIISIAGKKRYIGKNSFMLIHQLSSGSYGKYSELEDEISNNRRLMKLIKDIYKQYTKIPMKQLEEILKHDLWFDSATCLELGLVDAVI